MSPGPPQPQPTTETRSEQSTPQALDALWQRVRRDLEASVPGPTFDLWIDPLRPVRAQGSKLYLTAPDRVRRWVERRYAPRVARAVRHQEPSLTEVGFIGTDAAQPPANTPHAQGPQGPPPIPLNGSYSFDRFVIGPGNRFAHSAALAVAELPGEAYNPLFLHGPPGLGKTHLMVAIAHYLRHHHPELAVRYTTAEQFTADFVTAMRSETAQAFKSRHREVGALLIDDVQFLEQKPRTEEEFFHTFNVLYEAGSQLVLSSDRPPSALSRLPDRLRDRFEWGLCVRLQPPDLRTRLTLLRRLASESPAPPPDIEVLREIALRVPANLRQLEGALTRVAALASLLGQTPTPPLVRDTLTHDHSEFEPDPQPPGPSQSHQIEAIIGAVCVVLHLSREDLLSAKRTPDVTRGRHLAMYICRQRTDLSLAEIGRFFDRDHTTVLHAIRNVSRRLQPSTDIHRAVEKVEALLDTASQRSTDNAPHPPR